MPSLQFEMPSRPDHANLLPAFDARDFQEGVSVGELAQVLKISERRVYQLCEKGILPGARRGRYPLRQAVSRYISFMLQGGLEKRRNASGIADPKGNGGRNELVTVQIARARLRLERESGELVPIQAYKDEMREICSTIRNRFLSLPQQISPRLVGASAAEIEAELDAAIREALTALSRGEDSTPVADAEAASDIAASAGGDGEAESGGILQTSAKTESEG